MNEKKVEKEQLDFMNSKYFEAGNPVLPWGQLPRVQRRPHLTKELIPLHHPDHGDHPTPGSEARVAPLRKMREQS